MSISSCHLAIEPKMCGLHVMVWSNHARTSTRFTWSKGLGKSQYLPLAYVKNHVWKNKLGILHFLVLPPFFGNSSAPIHCHFTFLFFWTLDRSPFPESEWVTLELYVPNLSFVVFFFLSYEDHVILALTKPCFNILKLNLLLKVV